MGKDKLNREWASSEDSMEVMWPRLDQLVLFEVFKLQ